MGVLMISDEDADRLMAEIDAAKQARADEMPNDAEALKVMLRAWQRLKELGWREAVYCPKDGSSFDVIEAGSTGIHRCHYEGEWPTGSWWIEEAGDLWPSRPILFRLDPEAETERKRRMAESAARFAAEKNPLTKESAP